MTTTMTHDNMYIEKDRTVHTRISQPANRYMNYTNVYLKRQKTSYVGPTSRYMTILTQRQETSIYTQINKEKHVYTDQQTNEALQTQIYLGIYIKPNPHEAYKLEIFIIAFKNVNLLRGQRRGKQQVQSASKGCVTIVYMRNKVHKFCFRPYCMYRMSHVIVQLYTYEFLTRMFDKNKACLHTI